MAHKRRLASRALHVTVATLAPASRVMAPSSNNLITTSVGRLTQPRLILDFSSEEGKAAVHQWYERQGSNTRFTSLEYRKCRERPFKHEFIFVRLDRNTLCRFDRRPQENLRGHALKDEGTATEDSAQILCLLEAEYQQIVKKSEVLLTISFPDGEDLKLILAVCFGIQTHPRAASYSLPQYNCYFFAWTIVTTVARRALNWENAATSEVVREAVCKVVNGDAHTHTVPSHSKFTRIRNWFGAPATHHSLTTLDEQRILDFCRAIESRLTHIAEFWDLGCILRKLLIRFQLAPVLMKETRRFVQATWLCEMCSLVKGDILQLISGEISSPGIDKSLSAGVQKLAESICHTAAKITAIRCGRSSENESSDARLCFPDEDAWHYAGRDHYPELELLRSQCGQYDPEHDSVQLPQHSAASEQFGMKVKTIGNRVQREIWEKYDRVAAEHCALVAKGVAAALLEILVDIDPERLIFGKNAKHAWLVYCRQNSKDAKCALKDPPLQDYIRSRMRYHFDTVDKFGFGTFEELLKTAEESMCEIWVAALDVLDHDIPKWGIVMDLPERQDPVVQLLEITTGQNPAP